MIDVSVLTPDKEIFVGQIESVKVPGVQGQFQILHNHAPIVSALEAGDVFIVTAAGSHKVFDSESGSLKAVNDSGKQINFSIEGGFIEVLNNKIAILVQGVDSVSVQ